MEIAREVNGSPEATYNKAQETDFSIRRILRFRDDKNPSGSRRKGEIRESNSPT